MTLKPKTTVAILVEQQYQELELWYPYYRLKEAGATVHLVGPEKGKSYVSKLGYPAVCDTSAKEMSADQFHGLIIPGGFCPDYIRRSPAMIDLVKAVHTAKKPLAAICHGPWVLCSTTALQGREATCFASIKDDVINAGATYVDRDVVVSGHVITSRTPDDLPAFMKAFLELLAK
jgi:protease I